MWDKRRAYRFIVLMGLVSLFSDFTYEGAKSVIGPYLASLGAGAFAVGLLSGASEVLGYWVRLFAGLFSDRKPWGFVLCGYAFNLFSVPLLGFAKSWQVTGALLLAERAGKGLRAPARDALLSKATALVGHGKGFGLHELLDQAGAVAGPLLVGLLLFLGYGYRAVFFALFLPAFSALLLLLFAKRVYSGALKVEKAKKSSEGLDRKFYLYLIACLFVAGGFLPFSLIGFHLSKSAGLEGWSVAFLFAFAMAVDAFSAFVFGFLYDRAGFLSLFVALFLGMLSAPLLFLFQSHLLAVFLWGISLGAQESILRSGIARLSPEGSRGKAYGLFHFFFGLSTFAGALFMGLLYELSVELLVVYSTLMHLFAFAFLLRL